MEAIQRSLRHFRFEKTVETPSKHDTRTEWNPRQKSFLKMTFNSIIHSFCPFGSSDGAQNRKFDARGALTSLARAKIFFEDDQTHICCRVLSSEQNDTFSSVLAWKAAEKIGSNLHTHLHAHWDTWKKRFFNYFFGGIKNVFNRTYEYHLHDHRGLGQEEQQTWHPLFS